MHALKKSLIAAIMLGAGAAAWTSTALGHKTQFLLGGAMVNAGYRLQDPLESYDFAEHDRTHTLTPQAIWDEMLLQNRLAAGIRSTFPRTTRHPLVALVACMDARLDTHELCGDTRQYYYVLRTAGSALAEKEADMLELAVDHGVKLVVLTRHSDCAAERAAKDPESRGRYPALCRAVDVREAQVAAFLSRDGIRRRIEQGSLLVKEVDVDTLQERLRPR
jgi:carbonic anhydrase